MRSESYTKAVTTLAAGAFYVIGYGGDDDPKRALTQVVIVNTGTVAIRVGHSLTGILADGRYQQIAAGGSLPIEGPIDNLLVYNFDATTAASFTVQAQGCERNSGQDGGVLCATDQPGATTRYQVIRLAKVANVTTPTTVPVKYQRTYTTIKGYSVTVAAAAGAITIDLLNPRGLSMLTAIMSAKAHTTKTLYTATTLASANGSLTVTRDCTLSFLSSAPGDTLGDALIELAHVIA